MKVPCIIITGRNVKAHIIVQKHICMNLVVMVIYAHLFMPCVLSIVHMIRYSTWKEEFLLLRVSKTFLTYYVYIQYMLWFSIHFFTVLAVIHTLIWECHYCSKGWIQIQFRGCKLHMQQPLTYVMQRQLLAGAGQNYWVCKTTVCVLISTDLFFFNTCVRKSDYLNSLALILLELIVAHFGN
jgi:hypothetical protein